jgi:hypothetical protein
MATNWDQYSGQQQAVFSPLLIDFVGCRGILRCPWMLEFPKKPRAAGPTSDSILFFIAEDEVLACGCLFWFPLLICDCRTGSWREWVHCSLMGGWLLACLYSIIKIACCFACTSRASEYSRVYLFVRWNFWQEILPGVCVLSTRYAARSGNYMHVCPRCTLYRGRSLLFDHVVSLDLPRNPERSMRDVGGLRWRDAFRYVCNVCTEGSLLDLECRNITGSSGPFPQGVWMNSPVQNRS